MARRRTYARLKAIQVGRRYRGTEASKLEKTDEEADVIVEKEIDQKMAESAEIEGQDPREYRYEDIAWPRCTLVKPVYDEELGKFKNIRYPLLVKKALEGKK